jgi:cyclopropane fatty-acyl-phospholipid synthase-like methyltransferase
MNPGTEKFFHAYAADFNAIYGAERGLFNSVVSWLFRKSMKIRFIKTMEACQPTAGADVLDIGCGPGHYSVALARMGAKSVLGVDFADGMLNIARERARLESVESVCRFEKTDFFASSFQQTFDYVVVMGFMDYVEDARAAVKRIMELTRRKAVFSFPVAGGFLAWQRKLRYRFRCPLHLYEREQVKQLFNGMHNVDVDVVQIHRDYFVTATKK